MSNHQEHNPAEHIRNFVIIAHIDSGKSTLADRLLETTGTIEARAMRPQYLDQLDLERERGITIKMAPVRMMYHPDRGQDADGTRNSAEKETHETELLYRDLTYKIRGVLFRVRKEIGLGHKEQVYHRALEIEFAKAGLAFESKKNIPLRYEGQSLGTYQPDFIVEEKVLIELKALPEIGRPQIEQVWSYVKGCPYKLGLLVNYGSRDLDIQRIVYDTARNFIPRSSASRPRQSAQVEQFMLNLIDTPGHSDFSYEVSRALTAVEGAVLLVDGTKGIQAQTLANLRAARRSNLTIIGAVNKIDVASAAVDSVAASVAELLGVPKEEVLKISAKTGAGVPELLRKVAEKVPPPRLRESASGPRPSAISARALIFDSLYDDHKGIVAFVRVFGGTFRAGDDIRFAATDAATRIKEAGYFSPKCAPCDTLHEGEIGYIATGLKEPALVKIGDTIVGYQKSDIRHQTSDIRHLALPGYKEPQPVVFISFYPDGETKFEDLERALARLKLNDAALHFEPDANEALGRGFKVGFLGQLHFEIAASRLTREFNLTFLTSFPSVAYRVQEGGVLRVITQPQDFPAQPDRVWEPLIRLEIVVPPAYLNQVLSLQHVFEFTVDEIENLGAHLALTARMPLRELIRDFDDRMKSASAGFASFSYELAGEAESEVEKLEVLIANEVVPALTRVVPTVSVAREARHTVERLKELLPKQQFAQALQARAEGRILARETIPAMKKLLGNFGKTGGDRTRKMKLWKKQKEGKKRLLSTARVSLSPEVFREILKK